MTNQTPTPGHAPGLSEYLATLQSKAIRLSGVLSALGVLNNEGHCEDGQTALIGVAEQLAHDLNNGLDIVSLPRGAML